VPGLDTSRKESSSEEWTAHALGVVQRGYTGLRVWGRGAGGWVYTGRWPQEPACRRVVGRGGAGLGGRAKDGAVRAKSSV
jgi:hypothetical protein